MFYENVEYDIISDIPLEEVQKYLIENNIYLNMSTTTEKWAGFSHYYGRENGLNDVYAGSFANMVAQFITGMSCSCGTEVYLKEEKIEYEILKISDKIFLSNFPKEEKVKMLFKEIFNFYKQDDFQQKYEIAYGRLDCRLTYTDSVRLEKVEGNNPTEKVRNLLRFYDDHRE